MPVAYPVRTVFPSFGPGVHSAADMNLSRLFRVSAVSVALALSTVSVVACGGKEPNAANVKPGPMPEGETWDGVYYHPVYGYLHLVDEGGSLVGRWKSADQSKWGELSGSVDGNVAHYMWKEHKIGMIGPSATSQGKGFFVYKIDDEGHAVLDGQFGLGDEETGSDWHNVKQANMRPDLKSITGADPDTDSTGDF